MSPTPIGASLGRSPGVTLAAATIAALLVTWDLAQATRYVPFFERLAPSAAALAALLVLRADPASLGFTLRPRQGWWWWIKAMLLFGLAFVLLFVPLFAVLHLTGLLWFRTGVPLPPGFFDVWVPYAVLGAPITEEPVYRLVLCAALVPLCRPWPTIAVSGITFAALHFVYGTPSPDNFLAGYLMAWAYLRSGSFVVPLVMHGLGNACVAAFMFILSRL